jgi:hypothetical protein
MKLGVLGIELFAIAASYLILTLPAASATTVKIYSQEYLSATTTYNPWYMIEREIVINPPWDSPTVSIGVSNSTPGVVVESVLLYRCRGMNPSACVSAVEAEYSEGELDTEFGWGLLADQTVSYNQQANILIMVRMNDQGKPLWAGFWIGIERSSEQGFDISEDDLNQIYVYADTGYINKVKEFITNNHMIPANPLWVSRIVLMSATSIYELGFDQPGDIEGRVLSGSEVTSVSRNYTLLLPEVSRIRSPVVLYRNPSYMCGDSRCEDGSGGTEDLGENSGNCCLDCPCSPGWYCDSSWGCRLESGIELKLYGSTPSGVSNCYESHVLNIPVEVRNAPSGMSSLVSAWYSLRNDRYGTSCTRLSGTIYSCPVTVPVMDDCTEGVFTLGPNKIGVQISFMDGAQSRTMELETGLPDITIGSFRCGQGGCESELGEDWENCCYDCGCPDGYCDYETGSPKGDFYCRQDPQGSDISARHIEPDHFSVFSESGETVDMNIVIRNAPRSLDVAATSCDMGCLKGENEEPCTATCSVTGCSELASSDPEVYNMSCRLFVDIDGYDAGYDYTLSPSLGFRLSYKNASVTVTKSIVQGLRDITVGAQRCGDGVCTGNENPGDCCYDCPCSEGYYCDTRNIDGPTTGVDTCKPLSGTRLVIDEIGNTYLEDSTKPQIITIKGHVPDPASGFAISGACNLANDPSIDCAMYCQGTGYTGSGYGIECNIHIPPIGYTTTGLPYYDGTDPDNRVLRLQPNSYIMTLSYNDGSGKREDFYSEPPLGTVEITVISHCGNSECEGNLGENQASCCMDCGCSDSPYGEGYFCYMGANPSTGNCIKNDTILLDLVELDPYPIKCTIGYTGGACRFSQMGAYVRVINAPPDIEVIDASYIMEGQDGKKTTCVPGEGHGNFTCPLLLDELEGVVGTESRTLDISLYIRYGIGGAEVVQSINTSTRENIAREKSEALISCENEMARLQGQINALESNADEYGIWADIMHVMAIALFTAFAICMSIAIFSGARPSPPPEGPVISLRTGITPSYPGPPNTQQPGSAGTGPSAMDCMWFLTMAMQALMMAMMMDSTAQNTDMQRQGLEMQLEQKRLMCSSEGFPGLADATQGISYIPMS